MSAVDDFFSGLAFEPDDFQREAARALEAGRSVVVTAPTGAGKTLVAEAGIQVAFSRSQRVFYTTPLKALSNQKFGDFSRAYGEGRVGLLTGDNSVRGDADLVVMTTEVLRNMIYSGSASLEGLGLVVLDEVHYIQDRFRGMVWEEVIIHLPQPIKLACLSATISNPEEFTEWVASRRGDTELILERHRPVPLESLYLFKQRHHGGALDALPLFVGRHRQSNTQLERMLRKAGNRHGRFGSPRRLEVTEWLRDEELLPAIYFVFSRKGCDEAARRVGASLALTAPDERAAILGHAQARTAHLPEDELVALGYGEWVETLSRGVAAHHAGLVPAFKETVEDLFAAGLIKVVFATETLALGINMPARSVVLDKLSRFTGDGHELLEPGDYTQLTGRAGRRGIDRMGTAIVLHSRFVPIDRVMGIAAAGSHPLRSSFRPNYNMAVNLIANYAQAEAEALLQASFGQFQQLQRRDELKQRAGDLEERLTTAREHAECERGDVWSVSLDGPDGHATRMRAFARQLEAGDVLELESRRGANRAVMLSRGVGSQPRLLLLGEDGRLRRVGPHELPAATAKVGHLSLPMPFRPREKRYQRNVLSRLRETGSSGPRLEAPGATEGGVTSCPDLASHLDWVRRARRLERDLERIRRRARQDAGNLVAEFTVILGLLRKWGYVDGWSLTIDGEMLRGVYNESDLVVAEAVRRGAFAELDSAETAALASAFVYDPRYEAGGARWPTARLHRAAGTVDGIAADLVPEEDRLGITPSRLPDWGFAEAAYQWAAGVGLEDLVHDDLSGGDFVRTCRQTIDLLRQLADTYGGATGAHEAAAALDRGVVAAGGIS